MRVLTQQTIPAYLAAKGLLEKGEPLEITHIPSNVNHVYRVSTSKRTLIVKQAMDRSGRFPDIPLDAQRTQVEHDAIQVWKHATNVSCVPNIAYYDKQSNILVFHAAPTHATMLTEELLAGKARPEIAKKIFTLLAKAHNHGLGEKKYARRFSKRLAWESLQFGLFHNAMAQADQHQQVKHAVEDLMTRTRKNMITLIHGDVTPKNILVWDSHFLFIDFELSHFGDPAYDAGKLLAHYFLSGLIHFDQREQYFHAMREGWKAYESASVIPYQTRFKRNMIQHFGPLLWARAFGRANVPFLDERLKQCVHQLSRRIVVGNYTELEDIFRMADSYQKELKNLPKVDVASAMKQVLF